MTDFVKSLKRAYKASTLDTVDPTDVMEIINDNLSDWKEIMLTRASNGLNFLDIEFRDGERVSIMDRNGRITYDIDEPKKYGANTVVVRSYPSSQFYNSDEFHNAFNSIFPGCPTSIHYIGNSTYTFRISW